ncbi:hypothetical protein RHGRI_010413 [Rhododendron griersonianum]|uniref:Uncharacterized protein n=1 Tax=Rhododendron griersonianum TaxID=479676 RepID=A0AAV6KIG9_9ERIC|nr:hypothetical protein RHGRI_010413 [Rhododendron griersonianum]
MRPVVGFQRAIKDTSVLNVSADTTITPLNVNNHGSSSGIRNSTPPGIINFFDHLEQIAVDIINKGHLSIDSTDGPTVRQIQGFVRIVAHRFNVKRRMNLTYHTPDKRWSGNGSADGGGSDGGGGGVYSVGSGEVVVVVSIIAVVVVAVRVVVVVEW